MYEPIRSHLPNENYRRGWDETFGVVRVDIGNPSDMVIIKTVERNVVEFDDSKAPPLKFGTSLW